MPSRFAMYTSALWLSNCLRFGAGMRPALGVAGSERWDMLLIHLPLFLLPSASTAFAAGAVSTLRAAGGHRGNGSYSKIFYS